MADTKEYRARFNIGAVWTGQPGVQKAQRALGGIGKAAKAADVHVTNMGRAVFKGMVAYGVASKAIQGVTDTLIKSISAATEAQEAHDELFTTIERMSRRYKNTMGKSVAETSKIVEESTQALIKASEEMEKTGHDAETLQKGWAKLAATGALDPQQILAQRQAFSDVLSYIDGANATAEESAQLGEQWADAILRGNIALLKQMDLTDGEIQLLKNVNAQVKKGTITGEEGIKRRQDLVLKFAKKFAGETERVFDRPTGKVQHMWTMIQNIYETLGDPFVQRAGSMAESFEKITPELQKIATKLAEITDEKLKEISKWMDTNGPEIPERLDEFFQGLDKLFGILWKIKGVLQTIEDFEFGALKWLYEKISGAPPLPWLPGQKITPQIPAAMDWRYGGTTGGPTTTAAANQQLEAARKAEEGKRSSKYPPYQRESQALQVQKRAEEATKAAPTPTPTTQTSHGPVTQTAEEAKTAAQVLKEAQNRNIPAAIRHRNPGAQWPSKAGGASHRFGQIGEDVIGGGNKIATFPTAVHGAAANMATLAEKYVGMLIGGPSKRSAMKKWSGEHRQVPGPGGENFDLNKQITAEMVKDPNFVIPFMKAIANAEAPHGAKALTDAQWRQAFDWYMAGKPGGGKALAEGPTKAAAAAQKTTMAGSSLKDILNEMNLKRRMGWPSGGQSVAFNNNINVNGVQPGREALMAKKTALALRSPLAEGLRQLKELRAEDRRTNFA